MFTVAAGQRVQRNELNDIVLAGGALGLNWLPVHLALCAGIFEASGLRVSLKRTGSAEKATAAVKAGRPILRSPHRRAPSPITLPAARCASWLETSTACRYR